MGMSAVLLQGDGPNVLFIHSSGLSSRQWSRWLRSLPQIRAIVPDLPGCGQNAAWEGGSAPDEDLGLVLQLLEAHGPCHMVGHSYGGVLCLHAALDRPDLVRSIFVYEPPLIELLATGPLEDQRLLAEGMPPNLLDPETAGTEPWLRRFVDWWNGPGAWDQLAAPVRAEFLRNGRKTAAEVIGLSTHARPLEAYASLRCPVLAVRGDRSPAVIATALARLGTLPCVRSVTLEQAGHMEPLTHPERLIALAKAFLAE